MTSLAFSQVCMWRLGDAYTQVAVMAEKERASLSIGDTPIPGVCDRDRMRARQAKDGRTLRNRLTEGEQSRWKNTNKHPQAPSEHP